MANELKDGLTLSLAKVHPNELARFGQYLGVWAMEERAMRGALARIEAIDLAGHIEARAATKDLDTRPGYSILEGGVALIDVIGVMTKYGSSLSQMEFGTTWVRRTMRRAAADDQVRGIMLLVDSPGGTVSGSTDLAEDVAMIAARKPTWCYVEDMAASAGYWVASQAEKIIANPTAMVGSIGVYMSVYDQSAQFEREGIRVHVIRSSPIKGAGVPGDRLTDEQLNAFQKTVDDLNDLFISAIAKGRKLSRDAATKLADARIHIGQQAVDAKLVDKIDSFDRAVAELQRRVGANSGPAVRAGAAKKETAMNETTAAAPEKSPDAGKPAESTPRAATIQELAKAFPRADDPFLVACMKEGLTLEQAKDKWVAKLEADNEKLAKQAPKPASGLRPAQTNLSAKSEDSDLPDAGAIDAFHSEVRERMKSGNLDRFAAMRAVAAAKPQLYEQYMLAVNGSQPESVIQKIKDGFASTR